MSSPITPSTLTPSTTLTPSSSSSPNSTSSSSWTYDHNDIFSFANYTYRGPPYLYFIPYRGGSTSCTGNFFNVTQECCRRLGGQYDVVLFPCDTYECCRDSQFPSCYHGIYAPWCYLPGAVTNETWAECYTSHQGPPKKNNLTTFHGCGPPDSGAVAATRSTSSMVLAGVVTAALMVLSVA